jgi:MFS family permease
MIGAPLIGWGEAAFGVRTTLASLAVVVLAGFAACAVLCALASIRTRGGSDPQPGTHDSQWPLFLRLAAVFFLAAAAGLMVLGQAAGIVRAYGGAVELALLATTVITGCIAAARIAGGWLCDRFSTPRVAAFAHLWSLAGALALTLWPGPVLAVPALAMVGMGYGFISGLAAAAVARYWHRDVFGHVASRLYVAWCVAALSLPVLAGWLFDRTQGYVTPVAIAAGLNVLGAVVARGLPHQGRGLPHQAPIPARGPLRTR